jgi:glucose-1-phosphate cytidylyltransferase
MKVAILAGGFGSRLAEETEIRPKPMVEIGSMPILWHIMQHYIGFGHEDFVVALGYKGEYIKRWFHEQARFGSHMRIDMRSGEVESNRRPGHTSSNWKVDLVDTGLSTQTGGRLKRLEPYLRDGTFCLTWGDGVSDVDLNELIAFHRAHGKLATVTAVRPPARYGKLDLEGQRVAHFTEKPQLEEGWINGAFFVLEPQVSSTTSRATRRSSSGSRWRTWPATASSWPTATRGSGSAWIPSGTSVCWRTSGSRATRPGGRGSRSDANSGDRSSRLHRHDPHPHAPAGRARGRGAGLGSV